MAEQTSVKKRITFNKIGSKHGGTSDNNRSRIIRKIADIQSHAIGKGIDKKTISKLMFEAFHSTRPSAKLCKDGKSASKPSTGDVKSKSRTCLTVLAVAVAIVASGLGFIVVAFNIQSFEDFSYIKDDFFQGRCLVDAGPVSMEMARPLIKCSMCENLREVPTVRDISPEEFRERYAYSGTPLLVKDATVNWTAMASFSFQFFKDLYSSIDGAIEEVENECQFFPYKTEFQTFGEVLNMSEARATFQPGEKHWYIGWSNCKKETQMRLREHYQRPYFLPDDSESSIIDWMFMGGSGPGALMHLDYVVRPSWQAQISGKKTWYLVPVPECESVCHNLNVTMEKGDILVVNANVWYHSTFVHPGDISICIGSEYD